MRKLLLLAAALFALTDGAWAQQPRQIHPLTGDLVKDIKGATQDQGPESVPGIKSPSDIAKKIRELSLPDFKYAAALAHTTNNTITSACWDAWVDLLEKQNAPLKDAAGVAIPEPDPHLISDAERMSELLNQLQPNSPISIGCAAVAQAAQKQIATLIGSVLSGGALGLFKLPIVPIP